MMKKRLVSLVLAGAATLSMTVTAFAASLPSDIPDGAWYQPAVQYVLDNGLMGQTEQGTFAPDRAMIRQDIADAIWRDAKLRGLQTEYGIGQDLMRMRDYYLFDGSYLGALSFCYHTGIMSGDSEGFMQPWRTITREELAAVLARYDQLILTTEASGLAGSQIVHTGFGNWNEAEAEMQAFTDYAEISAWAHDAVTACLADGLLQGNADGSFHPQGIVTRAEMAQTLYDFSLK